jgi:hypothetical protein
VSIQAVSATSSGIVQQLNTRWHRRALQVFALIVLLHWAEHLVQALQIWGLDRARPEARGVLGQVFPWLVSSEWLHFAYAVVMLVGFALLLPGFVGRARIVWALALGIQVWHFIEHGLLFYQVQMDDFLGGRTQATSVAQLVFPRVELHLFYNAIVTIPMLIALYYHRYPPRRERTTLRPLCTCPAV